MEKMLRRGSAWLRSKLEDVATEIVELHTPHGVIEQLDATPGRRDFEQYGVGDAQGTEATFDWIVAEQDLFVDGIKREPAPGWEIRWHRTDGSVAIYSVLPNSGSRCFDVVDQLGILYRIHTKLIRIDS